MRYLKNGELEIIIDSLPWDDDRIPAMALKGVSKIKFFDLAKQPIHFEVSKDISLFCENCHKKIVKSLLCGMIYVGNTETAYVFFFDSQECVNKGMQEIRKKYKLNAS